MLHIDSIDYIKLDPHFSTFAFLNNFTFLMLVWFISGNLVEISSEWEEVGLDPYLPVKFWFTRLLANKAAIEALLINWVGEFEELTGIFLIL